jgi:hypothetical protein
VGPLVRERMTQYRPLVDAGIVEPGAQLLEQRPLEASARTVVLHGDFNPANVLSAERAAWLAIDAKPMVGDAAYDPVPMIRQVGDLYDRYHEQCPHGGLAGGLWQPDTASTGGRTSGRNGVCRASPRSSTWYSRPGRRGAARGIACP